MKRGDLLRHLRKHGCHLKREGRSHSLWTNPATGALEAIPRHTEISDIRGAQDLSRALDPRDRSLSLANNRLDTPGEAPAADAER